MIGNMYIGSGTNQDNQVEFENVANSERLLKFSKDSGFDSSTTCPACSMANGAQKTSILRM